MPTLDILKTYSVVELRKEVGKARMKNYSKLKKGEVMDLMMKNKEKFHHLKGKTKMKAVAKPKAVAKAVAKPKAAAKPKAVAKPVKKEPAYLPADVMKNIKGFMNVGKDAKVRKMDVEKIIEKLEKEMKKGVFGDLFDFEEWLDGKGPDTERGRQAQLERASARMMKSLIRIIKFTMRDKRFKTDNDVVRFWLKYDHLLADEYIYYTAKELKEEGLPDPKNFEFYEAD